MENKMVYLAMNWSSKMTSRLKMFYGKRMVMEVSNT